MNRIKVYDADGKQVDSYTKSIDMHHVLKFGDQAVNLAGQVRALNANGFYVKGQVTSKGVKIK